MYLDLARGIGALLVAAWHIRNGGRAENYSLINLHYAVVDFFFLLSGFVLFPRLQRFDNASSGEPTHRWFLWHRFLRLWPLTLIILFFALLLEIGTYLYEQKNGRPGIYPAFAERPLWALPVAALFGQLVSRFAWNWYAPLWSIAALWWATCATVATPHFKKVRYEWLLLITGVGMEILILINDGTNLANGDFYFGFTGFARALIGFNLGLILRRHQLKNQQTSKAALGMMSIIGFIVLVQVDHMYQDRGIVASPFVLIPFVLLLANIDSSKLSDKTSHFFTTVGKYSFPIFIWHILIMKLYAYGLLIVGLQNGTLDHLAIKYPVIIAITVAVSGMSMKYFEPKIERIVERTGLRFLPFLRTTPQSQAL